MVSFDWSAQKILAHFRAFTPWPGVYISSGLKLLEISSSQIKSNLPLGAIAAIEEDGAHIVCQNGLIIVHKVQAPSKKPLHVRDYLKGQRRGVGDILF